MLYGSVRHFEQREAEAAAQTRVQVQEITALSRQAVELRAEVVALNARAQELAGLNRQTEETLAARAREIARLERAIEELRHAELRAAHGPRVIEKIVTTSEGKRYTITETRTDDRA
jgi:predicted nuclease with TOPRIM domain